MADHSLLVDIRSSIDHAILRPELTRTDVDVELEMAARYQVFSVCVRPCDVGYAVEQLGSTVVVGTVIGFPHGTTSTAAKIAEVREALAQGASEFDMVLNIGWLRGEMLDEVKHDIAAVVEAAQGKIVKVIVETSLLTNEQIVTACRLSEEAGASFVKTSTGFAGGGATVEHIALMRANVGDRVHVKASGGVRSLDALLALHAAGATRFGTSATAVILDEAAARDRGASPRSTEDETSY